MHNIQLRTSFGRKLYRDRYLYLMFFPVLAFYILFKYVPMYGVVIAFKDFKFTQGILGSAWVGLKHFTKLFQSADFYLFLRNTLVLNLYSIIFVFPVPIILAIFINDLPGKLFKKGVQSSLYIPHFMSWVVLGGILATMLSPRTGIVNHLLKMAGLVPIFFMADSKWWIAVYIFSSIWQGAGWGTIIYLAAITGIDSELYEAAKIDGAGKFRQIWHVTIPGIRSTIAIMLILRVGQMMDVGFEQIYALQNEAVRNVSEVISTYVYRIGITGGQYSYTAAIGLFQSVISLILVVSTNKIVNMMGESALW